MTEALVCRVCGSVLSDDDLKFRKIHGRICNCCFRKKNAEYQSKHAKKRYNSDPEYKRKTIESHRKWRDQHNYIYPSPACNFLKHHHESTKDDPEHLTTNFLKTILGLSSSDCLEGVP